MSVTLTSIFDTVSKESTRPLLALEIIFFCVDQYRLNKHLILKHEIDEALCLDEIKRKGFAKNSSNVLTALEKSGILKKFSIVNGEARSYRGSPFPLAVSLENSTIAAFSHVER
ncbi:TPA: hypothetical protein F6U33_22380 [Citrobacter freundii]|jgi:hypothetical protein|uniref:Uncharacterized protein n=1 Tax=Klebsiella pneumoniae TaxID=573 RepID=A0A223DQI7_KLEPN|nr:MULTISPECIES: hypothetical protein [Enterobacteriaceae]ASS84977.1 Hypothetical protein [Klebsiella pneumoniae]MBA7999384.1 hypothetical protein [Citrobacter freundii]MBJ9068058.1 hypothetical protein [Citrobacter freundii]MCR3682727.1 hypothetical protein [Citrobacter freundii]NSL37106.1 hypothetical protein [Citrobacter werkmanii]